MRGLFLAVLYGCAAADPGAVRDPRESEVASLIASCSVGPWCVEAAPARTASKTLLHAVWASTAEDVFAVGDNGAILRRQAGADWIAMASGTTHNLRALWGSSSSDVWAGGASGALLHFDGAAWSPVDASISNVDGIWGSSADDVWFVGGSTALHWTGATFATTGFGGTLLAVSGTGPNDVWVTGETTNLHHYDGSGWSTVIVTGLSTNTLFSVFARATDDVWTSDFVPGKETAHWDGSQWSHVRAGAVFQSFAAVAADDVWAVGNHRVGHWNGSAWTLEAPFATSAALWSISIAAGNAWIVGSGGLIAHRVMVESPTPDSP